MQEDISRYLYFFPESNLIDMTKSGGNTSREKALRVA
jgi:hypothetical protein